ncbi:30S ribosomal protein S16 [Candidatus Falkowbacteria bacterium]|nr:30S ribosomal protein S16 [Candidatus Falkowbacteria bacterium]
MKLSRAGKRTQPHFKLIVTEKGRDPWGQYHELLGNYNPLTKKAEFNADRINHYIKNGAQLTDSVNNLLITLGIIKGKKRAVTNLTKKRRKAMADELAKAEAAKKKAQEEAEAKAAAEKAAKEKAEADAKAAAEAAAAAPAPEAITSVATDVTTPEVAPEAPAQA